MATPARIARAITLGLAPLRAPMPMSLSQWAEKHFYLSPESSYVEGPWRAYPYQPAIMDCMSNDAIREVDWRKAARVGYTKILLAAIGYFAQHKRRNQAIWQPVDKDSDEFCKAELEPMLRDVAVMRQVFTKGIAKHKHNTLDQKVLLGSTIYLRGGKAAKNYRRLSLDVAMLDELDGFDRDIESEGDPVMLARKRIEGATFPKLICGSTPKIKGQSMIEAREAIADIKLTFHVPCPHCNHEQALHWGSRESSFGFKWNGDDPESVAYLCASCGALFSQAEYLGVWALGRWKSRDGTWIDQDGKFRSESGAPVNTPASVAFHIWTAYSPMTTWVQIVREFLSATIKARVGDKSQLKTWCNTTLGESWEDEVEQIDEHELSRRAEPYQLRTVPAGVLALVAGVDVQDNRFEVVVWGIGRGEEMWAVDYVALSANPADPRDWHMLDAYLRTVFPHDAGHDMAIEAAAVDTGGHYTHEAYAFCRTRTRRKIYAVKGDAKQNRPIKGRGSPQDVNLNSRIIRRGVKLWLVGTDTAKDLLYGRIQVDEHGPGYIHFSADLPPDFYSQLTAEKRVLQRTSTGDVFRWTKGAGRRNEALDCTIYAIFASHMLDLHRYTEKMWERREATLMTNGSRSTKTNHEIDDMAPTERSAPMAVLRQQHSTMMIR